jgi:hypothetical protein
MATGWLSDRPLHLINLPAERGDTVMDVDGKTVLIQSAARIKICGCTKYQWKCEEMQGNTYCYKECVEWECADLPIQMVMG